MSARRSRVGAQLLRLALEGGRHRIDIAADGAIHILPIGGAAGQGGVAGDEAALDDEIRKLMADDAPHALGRA